jgi:hypothetical protein
VLTIGEFQYCRITVTYKTPQHVTLQNALTFFTAPCMDIVDGTCATPTVIYAAHLQSWLNQGLIGLKSEEKYNMFISSMYNGSLKNTVLTGTWASNTQPVCSYHMALSLVLFKSQIVAWLSIENSFNLKRFYHGP